MIPHLTDAVRVLMLSAAALTVLLAWRLSAHRPVAVFLSGQALVMLGRWALRVGYLRGAIYAAGGDLDAGLQPAPLQGWARVAGLVDVAAWLTWAAGLATLALWVFAPMPPDPAMAPFGAAQEALAATRRAKRGRLFAAALPWSTWGVLVIWISLSYPVARMVYPRLYAAVTLASVLASAASFALWLARAWGKDGMNPTRGCVALMVGCEAVGLAGPYVRGIYSFWWLDNAVQLIMYAALILGQGGALWMLKNSRS